MSQSDREQLQRALAIIDKLQARLAQTQVDEPLAVIGMACRFPGASTPEEFWELMMEGREALREVPPDRWDQAALYDPDPAKKGAICMPRGGFLDQVDGFDAQFFSISPREAEALDPQQRLLLEVTFEALERARIRPSTLRGTEGAVYVGIGANDYGLLRLYGGDYESVNVYDGTGNSLSFASGRISYALGLHGASLNLVTACSSSLVGVHLAAQSLQRGECDLAICAGVNLMLAPDNALFLSRTQALSRAGQCRAFDAEADGFVRSEGCGVVLLKRLAQARRDGNQILALVRGSGVNNDGPSAGFTAPNGEAQRRLLSQVLGRSGVAPQEIAYVECHGTATVLGDPIEVEALGQAYASEQRSTPLLLGSVKANVGHLEAAAGVASLIKAVMMLGRGTIPPQINFMTPNPHIHWDRLSVAVNPRSSQLAPGALVGVSGFGMSGTNAHILLSPADEARKGPVAPVRRPYTLPLSAKSSLALRQLAANYRDFLTEENLRDVCACAAKHRDAYEHRLAVVGESAQEMREQLQAFLADRPGAYSGRRRAQPRVAFLLTGQGSQYPAMGLALSQAEPTFAEVFSPMIGEVEGLGGVLSRGEPAIHQTGFAQPALFAIEYALARMWQSWGVQPQALLGHSVGEIGAACLAGVLQAGPALKLVTRRGQRMQGLPPGGVMTVAWSDWEPVAPHLKVELAAVNGPQQIVVSGSQEAMEEAEDYFDSQAIKHRRLEVSHAFHSALLDPVLEALQADAAEANLQVPRLRLLSNVSGQWAGEDMARPDYWARQARQPVQFHRGMQQLDELGIDLYLEIGPRPTLLTQGRHCLPHSEASWIASLRPQQSESLTVQQALAQLFVAGVDIRWEEVWRHHPHNLIDLPTYPWQRQRFWLSDVTRHARPSLPAGRTLPAYQVEWEALPPAESVREDIGWVVTGFDPQFYLALAQQLAPPQEGRQSRLIYVAAGCDDAAALCAHAAEVMRTCQGPMWIVTEQAMRVSPEDPPPRPAQAALWGLSRAMALETPHKWGGILDIGEHTRVEEAARELLCAGSEDDEWAIRPGARWGARLRPLPLTSGEPRLDGRGYYLVAGAGGLGLEAAHSLVDLGARRILLLSRQPRSGGRLQQLLDRGVELLQLTYDVADEGLLEVLARLDGPLKGIVHTAAALDDGLLDNLTRERFAPVFHPKLAGALNLARAARRRPQDLDFFLIYSSAAALLGNPGQANYCAANAALDALGERLREEGLPVTVLHWGPWAEVGMASRLSQAHQDRMREQGLEPFRPAQTTDLLSAFLAPGSPTPARVAMMQVDWPRFLHRDPRGGRALLGSPRPRAAAPSLLETLEQTSPSQRASVLKAFLGQALAQILRLPPGAEIDPDQGFFHMGMDSLMAGELTALLRDSLDLALPASLVFDASSLRLLTGTVEGMLFAGETEAEPSEEELALLIGEKFDRLVGGS